MYQYNLGSALVGNNIFVKSQYVNYIKELKIIDYYRHSAFYVSGALDYPLCKPQNKTDGSFFR